MSDSSVKSAGAQAAIEKEINIVLEKDALDLLEIPEQEEVRRLLEFADGDIIMGIKNFELEEALYAQLGDRPGPAPKGGRGGSEGLLTPLSLSVLAVSASSPISSWSSFGPPGSGGGVEGDEVEDAREHLLLVRAEVILDGAIVEERLQLREVLGGGLAVLLLCQRIKSDNERQ